MGQHRLGLNSNVGPADLARLTAEGVPAATVAEVARRNGLPAPNVLRRPATFREWVLDPFEEWLAEDRRLAEARRQHEESLWWHLERNFAAAMAWDALVEAGKATYPVIPGETPARR